MNVAHQSVLVWPSLVIAVRSPEAKARLRPIAWDQPPITDAAITFIVCGQLADSSVIPQRLAPLAEAGERLSAAASPSRARAGAGPRQGNSRQTLCGRLHADARRKIGTAPDAPVSGPRCAKKNGRLHCT
jgi:hypothetical protein